MELTKEERAIRQLLSAHYADRVILSKLVHEVCKDAPELRASLYNEMSTISVEVAEAFGVALPSGC